MTKLFALFVVQPDGTLKYDGQTESPKHDISCNCMECRAMWEGFNSEGEYLHNKLVEFEKTEEI